MPNFNLFSNSPKYYWYFTHLWVLLGINSSCKRHTRGLISTFENLNYIIEFLVQKKSLNANFHIFIQINREIIDILPISRVLFGLNWFCDATEGREFSKNSKFGLHNRILPAIISINANVHLFIQIPRGIIEISPILGYFWA